VRLIDSGHGSAFGAALFAFVLAAVLSILFPSLAAGQVGASNRAASEVTTSQAPAVFRSSSNLVQVPVVVRDNSGHAVGTLRTEDFEVLDNGKPETISRFSIEKFDTTDIWEKQASGQRRQSPGGRTTDYGGAAGRPLRGSAA
jgi:hypothetical protein